MINDTFLLFIIFFKSYEAGTEAETLQAVDSEPEKRRAGEGGGSLTRGWGPSPFTDLSQAGVGRDKPTLLPPPLPGTPVSRNIRSAIHAIKPQINQSRTDWSGENPSTERWESAFPPRPPVASSLGRDGAEPGFSHLLDALKGQHDPPAQTHLGKTPLLGYPKGRLLKQ